MDYILYFATLYADCDDGAERTGIISGILAAFPIDEMNACGYSDPQDFALAIKLKANNL